MCPFSCLSSGSAPENSSLAKLLETSPGSPRFHLTRVTFPALLLATQSPSSSFYQRNLIKATSPIQVITMNLIVQFISDVAFLAQ